MKINKRRDHFDLALISIPVLEIDQSLRFNRDKTSFLDLPRFLLLEFKITETIFFP